MLTIFDTRDEKIIRQIKDVGERGIFPYTMDSRNRIAYVCLGITWALMLWIWKRERFRTVFLRGRNRLPIGRMAPRSHPMKGIVDQRSGRQEAVYL